MATSRGGARGGSAGNLAAAAASSRASPLLQPEDALDAHAAPAAASRQFAPPSVSGTAGGSTAPHPGISAVELQTALSMIDEDGTRGGPDSDIGPLPRLQPRLLTVGGAPRKASDAMVQLDSILQLQSAIPYLYIMSNHRETIHLLLIACGAGCSHAAKFDRLHTPGTLTVHPASAAQVVSIDGAIAAAATEIVDDIRRRNAAAAAAPAAMPAHPLSVNLVRCR
jgi:hypothetical protein